MVVSFVVYVGRVILGGHDTIPDVFQEFGGFVAPYFPKKKAANILLISWADPMPFHSTGK